MLNLEKKLLCFVQKHIAVLGIACLLLSLTQTTG